MAGDQLVHSGYLQALTCLALGLRLDRVLCYTETPDYQPQPNRGKCELDMYSSGGFIGNGTVEKPLVIAVMSLQRFKWIIIFMFLFFDNKCWLLSCFDEVLF